MIKGLKKVRELAIQLSGGRTLQRGGENSLSKDLQMVAWQVCLKEQAGKGWAAEAERVGGGGAGGEAGHLGTTSQRALRATVRTWAFTLVKWWTLAGFSAKKKGGWGHDLFHFLNRCASYLQLFIKLLSLHSKLIPFILGFVMLGPAPHEPHFCVSSCPFFDSADRQW